MSRPEGIAEWAQLMAESAQDAAIARCKAASLAVAAYPFASGAAKAVLDDEIARALLAAEQRGAERGHPAIDALDSALCQFINNAADQYDPSVWVPSVRRDFGELSKAYNECHRVGVMNTQRSANAIRGRKA